MVQFTDKKGNIILNVVYSKPSTKRNGVAPTRLIRHLPIFDVPVYLRIIPMRYSCEYCDDNPTTTKQYDWCDRNASTTKRLHHTLLNQ